MLKIENVTLEFYIDQLCYGRGLPIWSHPQLKVPFRGSVGLLRCPQLKLPLRDIILKVTKI